ncbi:hypothetical protein EXE48_11730 [Halorubrum sp. ASP1]|uniref:hypothetical protein n=1 Tax=Halorubrum sp. ASP1 TaxID=2518114 RepID=UPI0010F923A9|nr:hypothetical protein [Halorubrum sp. ASP1]TKX60635.1 hypothetical protein EXE48_11730 [Halorubrum sp. ASP1]
MSENVYPAREIPSRYRWFAAVFIYFVGAAVLRLLIQLFQSGGFEAIAASSNVIQISMMLSIGLLVFALFFHIPWMFLSGRMGLQYSKVIMTRPLEYYEEHEDYVLVNEDDEPVNR